MWSTSTRRSRLPRNWATIRARILKRDRYRCQARKDDGTRCGLPANEVDHIRPGDDHQDRNLQALCHACHKAKTRAEAMQARGVGPTRKRPARRHPGLL